MRRKRISNAALAGLLCVFAVIFGVTAWQIFDRHSEYAAAQTEYAALRELAGTAVAPSPGTEPEGIDWGALRAINPNVVGWIEVPGTDISYPIVQGTDNAHYLNHTFTGSRNASGAVFLDHRDAPDFSGNARLYGHNMRDGSMFARLHGWGGDSFVIHTPDGVLEFAVIGRGALVVGEVNMLDGVVLITCVNGRPDVRLVVQGR